MKKLFFSMALLMLVLCSCYKTPSEVNGVAVNGELKLPLVSARFTVGDIFERLDIDTMLVFGEEGDIHYRMDFRFDDVLKGSDFLYFNDVDAAGSHEFEAPVVSADTTVTFSQTIELKSDCIRVSWAKIRSGQIGINATSDAVNINQLVIRCPEIIDANNVNLEVWMTDGPGQVDLSGYYYSSSEVNVLHLNIEANVTMQGADEDFVIEAGFNVTDLKVTEMRGYVEPHLESVNYDTVYSLFQDNLQGQATFCRAKVKLYEQNGFDFPSRITLDTVWNYSEGMEPTNIFESQPLIIDLEQTNGYVMALEETVCASLNLGINSVYVSGGYELNTGGAENEVVVSDTCSLDLLAKIDIPFAFAVQQMSYYDTVSISFSEIEYPELVKELLLGAAFKMSLPFNTVVDVFLYDSENGLVTYNVLEGLEIKGSVGGSQVTENVEVLVTPEKIESIIHSDCMVIRFSMDTGGQDVELLKDQYLDVTIKADLKYDGFVDFEN